MDTIKLLLAHADRRLTNQIEVAVLDVCFDRAVVKSTRTSRLDELVHQGTVRDFDLIVVGVDNLFGDRFQQGWAASELVSKAIEEIRALHSTPIIAVTASEQIGEAMIEAGADAVLGVPLNIEDLKHEMRGLLDLSEISEDTEEERWSGLGSLFRGFQKTKEVS